MIKAEDLRNTWRIILLVIVGQLVGLLIGFVSKFHSETFLSIWIGGAIGTLPGFIFGAIWHFSNQERRNAIPYFTVCFFALASIMLPFAAFQLLTGGIGYTKLKSDIANLDPSTIPSLQVYKGYETQNVITITEQEKINSFIKSCSDIQNNYTQHNKDCDNWTEYYISFSGYFPKDIILEYCQSDVVKGVFAIREGRTTTYHGTFTSMELRNWLSANVVPIIGQ